MIDKMIKRNQRADKARSMIEKLNRNREIADRIIDTEEWLDIETIQYNATLITISNYRTGKETQIRPADTEDTLRAKIEETYR